MHSGDTLSALAQRTGVGVAEIQAANCLESDLIVEGTPLYLPGGSAMAPPAAPAAPAGVGADNIAPHSHNQNVALLDLDSQDDSFNLLLAESLIFSNPGGGDFCNPQSNQAEPSITIGASGDSGHNSHGTIWRRGQVFGICWNSTGEGDDVTFVVTAQGHEVGRFPARASFALRWTVDANDPAVLYHVTTTQQPQVAASFEITTGSSVTPSVSIFNRSDGRPTFRRGQNVSFVAAGYDRDDVPLFVCRADGAELMIEKCFSLRNVDVGIAAAYRLQFPTQDLAPGTYLLHDDTKIDEIISRDDPRIFAIN